MLGNDFPESVVETLAEGPLDVMCVSTGSGLWVTRWLVPTAVSDAIARISITSAQEAQDVVDLVSTLSREVHCLTPAVLEPFIRGLVWLGHEDMAVEVLGWLAQDGFSSSRNIVEDAKADEAASRVRATAPEQLSARDAERLSTLAALVAQKKLEMNSPLTKAAVTRAAGRLGATPAQVLFRFLLAIGVRPLTGTKSEQHMREDVAAPSLAIEPDEVAAIEALLEPG